MHRHRALALAAALCGLSIDASASCGAAYCLVNTDWSAQGAWTEPGARIDLRYETIDLDQPRNGSTRVAVGEIPRHHDEVETKNRNFVAAFDWSFSPEAGLSLSLPYVDRDHLHIHNHQGEKIEERWSFRGMGDARLVGRYGMFSLGVKLPTGKHDVVNGDGEEAERTLQPGSGTTDAILGLAWSGAAPLDGWSWFARAQATLPMNSRDGFRPGKTVQLDGGMRYAASSTVGLMLQANLQVKDRDSGVNAEPEDSGQRSLYLSPGISWNITRAAQLYAFVQLPVYQAVNGVQLTADWSALAGVSLRF
jgi:hypothetical protein